MRTAQFFGLPAGSVALAAVGRPQCTITELAFIDDAVADGSYLLSLQLPALGGDALPSRPLLYPVRSGMSTLPRRTVAEPRAGGCARRRR